MPPRRKTSVRRATPASTSPAPKRKRGKGTPAPSAKRARGGRARGASGSSGDESSDSGEGSTQRHDETLAAEAGEGGSPHADTAKTDSEDDADADDFRADTLAYLAQLRAETDAKIAEIDARADFEGAIKARLDAIVPEPPNPDIPKLFALRRGIFEKLADIVAEGRATSHEPFMATLKDVHVYFRDERAEMVDVARDDAAMLMKEAADRARDPNTLREAKDMVKALRRTLRTKSR